MINATDVSFAHHGTPGPADGSFVAVDASVVGLIGPNDSDTTTLLRVVDDDGCPQLVVGRRSAERR